MPKPIMPRPAINQHAGLAASLASRRVAELSSATQTVASRCELGFSCTPWYVPLELAVLVVH